MSRLFDEYGLDMWTWYPALDKAYADPKAQMWSAPQPATPVGANDAFEHQ